MKADVTNPRTPAWDTYSAKAPAEALAAIHQHVGSTAATICNWYWAAIRTKRITSLGARGISFSLLTVGTAAPIVAGMIEPLATRLYLTQGAVIALAIAGLLQIADKVFGWSSGWMRYIATITAMQSRIHDFEFAWGKHLMSLTAPPSAADSKLLFDLAENLERDLFALQSVETDKWIAEFNQGTAVLDGMIKTQKEENQRRLEGMRGAVDNPK